MKSGSMTALRREHTTGARIWYGAECSLTRRSCARTGRCNAHEGAKQLQLTMLRLQAGAASAQRLD